ncbi:MAG TPA: hypothetical protein VHU80_15185 [Polyangiaceae bacterium]|nr:hypothetical protein [Polyangiaceae bacterium]
MSVLCSPAIAVSLARRLLLVPIAIPLSAALSPSRLESEAGAFGQRFGAAVSSIHAVCAPRPPVPPPEVESGAVELPPDFAADPLAAPPARHKRGARPAKGDAKDSGLAGGIFVDKDTVLRLARAGVVPSGQTVPTTATHPGGIELHGVGALGVGLTDGDILVEVEGRAVQTEGQVVGIVIGARSRHAERLSAVVWRASRTHPHEHPDAHNGERWSLVVAMPYL